MTTRVITTKNAIAAALLLAGSGFIMSLLIEHVGLLVPCELCLIQRWSVFAAMLFLGVTALSAERLRFDHQRPIYAQFSLSRIEPVPYQPICKPVPLRHHFEEETQI
jgi:disulfide bond formation protein DsbB